MSTVFVEPGEEATMRCKIVGYPPSTVMCSFIECSELMACDFNNELLLVKFGSFYFTLFSHFEKALQLSLYPNKIFKERFVNSTHENQSNGDNELHANIYWSCKMYG